MSPRLILSACLLMLAHGAHALSETEAALPPASPTASAPIHSTSPGFHFFISGGLTYGGDTLYKAVYTNGGSSNIKAGSLLQGGLGGLYQLTDQPLAFLLSANMHFDAASGSNGTVLFSRFPIEALAYYTGKERLRIGGGVRLVSGAETTAKVNGVTETMTFDNTRGLVAEIGYQLSSEGWLNFRIVSEKYQGKTFQDSTGIYSMAGTSPYSGSHLGVNFLYQF
ncbi:MAG: hypothetical protein Fur0040_09210 [Sideroxydans sp.]